MNLLHLGTEEHQFGFFRFCDRGRLFCFQPAIVNGQDGVVKLLDLKGFAKVVPRSRSNGRYNIFGIPGDG